MDDPTQLDRMEKKLDDVHALVHEHSGVISALKWVSGGLSAGIVTILGYLGMRHP